VRFPSSHLLAVFLGLCIQTFGQSVPPVAPVPRSATDVAPVFVPKVPVQSSTPRPHTDPLELQREARQVLELSQSIQSDFESINRGLLPKDTIEKLKRIEKLSRHLRSQIAP
jgi:hypothetical protein